MHLFFNRSYESVLLCFHACQWLLVPAEVLHGAPMPEPPKQLAANTIQFDYFLG